MALLTHDRWASLVSGRYVDIDGAFGGQCWDTFADYCISVLGINPIHNYGGNWNGWAYAIWDQYETNGAKNHFDKISPNQPARKGDTVIWTDRHWFYPASHIAIVEGDAGSSVYCMSQNSSPAQPWLPGYSTSATGPNIRQYLTKQGLAGYLRPKARIIPAGSKPPVKAAPVKPKEWDEMATKAEFKAAVREVLSEPAILDRIALSILKRDCYLVDPSGKTGKVVGKTNLATKINWAAHNDAQTHSALAALGVDVDGLTELLTAHTLELPDGAPASAVDGIVPSENGLQDAEFVTTASEA